MAFNNTSSVSPNKRNLKRTNRLHDNGNFSTYDNNAFENDKDNTIGDNGNALFNYEESFPQSEAMGSTGKPRSGSYQSLSQNENIELNVKNDTSLQQENRKVLESINIDASANTQDSNTNTNTNTDTKAPAPQTDKASKMTFNVSLKRFEATSNNNSVQVKDRLKLSRQAVTEDLSLNRRGSESFDAVDGGVSNFTRTSSLRVPTPRKRAPRLLRDISFSDADDTATKDYGSLKNMNLPRRNGKEPLSADTVAILESLMNELIKRGKIYQAAVLDLEESEVLASVPSSFQLSDTDAVGMTKSIICQPSLFRLQIGDVDYSCFKHRHDAVQGRATDLVMVMQMTDTCVVAGFSRDDAPGSCNSEVHEFAKVLEDAGW